jgi:hypothetical protein
MSQPDATQSPTPDRSPTPLSTVNCGVSTLRTIGLPARCCCARVTIQLELQPELRDGGTVEGKEARRGGRTDSCRRQIPAVVSLFTRHTQDPHGTYS